jgi:hypothetical protein
MKCTICTIHTYRWQGTPLCCNPLGGFALSGEVVAIRNAGLLFVPAKAAAAYLNAYALTRAEPPGSGKAVPADQRTDLGSGAG